MNHLNPSYDEKLAEAKTFIETHLKDCADDLMRFKDNPHSTFPREGRFFDVMMLCVSALGSRNGAQRLAENLIYQASLRQSASQAA